MLRAAYIKDVPTISRNPQANAMFERIYHKVGNILRVLLYTNLPITVANAEYLIDQALATEMNYMRVNFTTTPKGSPGYLLFDRDIF